MNFEIIGKKIRKRRKQFRLTQKQLAERIGRTESSIQKYEAGKVEIPFNVLEDIAKTLEVEIIELLDDFTNLQIENNIDHQRDSYLISLGYQSEYDQHMDFVTIKYNGYSYKISAIDYLGLLSDIDYEVHGVVDKFLEESNVEKTICNDYKLVIEHKIKLT